MKLTVTDTKENKLLTRKSIAADLVFQGTTPKKEDVMKEMVKILSVPEELIVINKIDMLYGKNEAKVTAYVYESAEIMKRYEKGSKNGKEKTG